MITADTPFTPEDDRYHPVSDDPYETETNWWSFLIPERRMGCWLHTPYYANRKTTSWRVFVWDDRGATPETMAYYKKVEEVPMADGLDLRDVTFPGGGYSLKMLKPLMDYRISYKDPARNFSLEFDHLSVHPPRRFTPGEAPMKHHPHLDQLGRIVGEMVLNGERIKLDTIGIRDRTWGPRGGPHAASQKPEHVRNQTSVLHPGGPRWREIERERGRGRIEYIFGHDLEAKNGFLGFVRPQDGDAGGWSPMNVGWIVRDGVFASLDKTRSRVKNYRDPHTGYSAHMFAEMTDELGRTMSAEGFVVNRMTEGHGANSLMRWEFDGKIGWGEDQDGWRGDHFPRMLDALRATR